MTPTMAFWVLAAGMIAVVLFMLVRPFMSRARSDARGDRQKRMSVYRQQFEELEQDFASRGLSEELYRQACSELERRLLEETAGAESAPASHSRLTRWVHAGSLAILIPTASVLLYLQMGDPLAMVHQDLPALTTGLPGSQTSRGIGELAEGLKRKLAQRPDDGDGWMLLARSYVELNRHAEAVSAFEQAVIFIPDDAQLFADYADALAVVHGRRLEGTPARLINAALALDPLNVKALLLAGTMAFDRRDYEGAMTYWERADAQTTAESALSRELTGIIAEAKSLRQGDHQVLPRSVEPMPVLPSRKGISGIVRLASFLDGRTSPGGTLFVFARAVEGPRMPVAIVRMENPTLPFRYHLDDSNSVMPGRTLSQAGEVVVVARFSKSGVAMPNPGDLEGMSSPIGVERESLDILIDTELPE